MSVILPMFDLYCIKVHCYFYDYVAPSVPLSLDTTGS